MSTQTLDAPCVEDHDDDAVHLFCCDTSLALCGVELDDADQVPDDDPSKVCVYCQYLDNTCAPCSALGCAESTVVV